MERSQDPGGPSEIRGIRSHEYVSRSRSLSRERLVNFDELPPPTPPFDNRTPRERTRVVSHCLSATSPLSWLSTTFLQHSKTVYRLPRTLLVLGSLVEGTRLAISRPTTRGNCIERRGDRRRTQGGKHHGAASR